MVWLDWWGRDLEGARPVIGHCDTGPWNILARDGLPVALIDWDAAGPVDGRWELAQAAWLNAQLHDDDVAERLGLPDARGRARQLRLIVDGYGLSRGERAGFVETLVAFAIRDTAQEAIGAGVTAESTIRASLVRGAGRPLQGQDLLRSRLVRRA